ncbi:MAG: 16S rRNA (guanine(527)-N(7))-methyltransferase RsmG [Rikenellaceae bacterium]
MGVELIYNYFPDLSERQKQQFAKLEELYKDWNEKINVISRKDMDSFYLHHVLHSLAIAKVCSFEDGARVIDVGCGGGFPGIPLAILYPNVKFTLVDSIGKKITVVRAVVEALGLENVVAENARVESLKIKCDYVVSRAVTEMSKFMVWVWPKIERGCKGAFPNGILYLKGGDLSEELKQVNKKALLYPITKYLNDEFFETKKVVYIQKSL